MSFCSRGSPRATEEVQITQEMTEEPETGAKSRKGNKSGFMRTGKQSFGSCPNGLAGSQAAARLLGRGWQEKPSQVPR